MLVRGSATGAGNKRHTHKLSTRRGAPFNHGVPQPCSVGLLPVTLMKSEDSWASASAVTPGDAAKNRTVPRSTSRQSGNSG